MIRIEKGIYQGMTLNGKVYRISKDSKTGEWFFNYVNSSVRITAKCKKHLVDYVIRLDNEFRSTIGVQNNG